MKEDQPVPHCRFRPATLTAISINPISGNAATGTVIVRSRHTTECLTAGTAQFVPGCAPLAFFAAALPGASRRNAEEDIASPSNKSLCAPSAFMPKGRSLIERYRPNEGLQRRRYSSMVCYRFPALGGCAVISHGHSPHNLRCGYLAGSSSAIRSLVRRIARFGRHASHSAPCAAEQRSLSIGPDVTRKGTSVTFNSPHRASSPPAVGGLANLGRLAGLLTHRANDNLDNY